MDSSSSSLPLLGDPLSLLGERDFLILHDGQCVLGAPSEQLTFHAVEDVDSVSEVTPLSNLQDRILANEIHDDAPRRATWSVRKITDFIQCIQMHDAQFRKSSRNKGNVWNDIATDMLELGHQDCSKDECSKKWNNLYRTWKKVKLRPKQDRRKWKYYQSVSDLVKSMYQRERDKNAAKKPSPQELILKLMEQNLKHEETVRKTEEKFQSQVLLLDKERDNILLQIKNILQA